jgi:hypothetical protein
VKHVLSIVMLIAAWSTLVAAGGNEQPPAKRPTFYVRPTICTSRLLGGGGYWGGLQVGAMMSNRVGLGIAVHSLVHDPNDDLHDPPGSLFPRPQLSITYAGIALTYQKPRHTGVNIGGDLLIGHGWTTWDVRHYYNDYGTFRPRRTHFLIIQPGERITVSLSRKVYVLAGINCAITHGSGGWWSDDDGLFSAFLFTFGFNVEIS